MHKQRIFSPPRPMTVNERKLLSFLLDADFPGRDELRQQAATAMVSRDCSDCPTLELEADRTCPRATVKRTVPIEAEGRDYDGMAVQILLHVVDGYLSELEVFRYDDKRIEAIPDPANLTLIDLDKLPI